MNKINLIMIFTAILFQSYSREENNNKELEVFLSYLKEEILALSSSTQITLDDNSPSGYRVKCALLEPLTNTRNYIEQVSLHPDLSDEERESLQKYKPTREQINWIKEKIKKYTEEDIKIIIGGLENELYECINRYDSKYSMGDKCIKDQTNLVQTESFLDLIYKVKKLDENIE